MTPTGLEIGSVAVKLVSLNEDLQPAVVKYLRHEGDFARLIRTDLLPYLEQGQVCITGPAAKLLLDLPYQPESECLEAAIARRQLQPDLLLTLGGENLALYTLRNGEIRDLHSSPKCAAGGGEFLFQQFMRMGFSPDEGIAASRQGQKVKLAARCSVYCKSDATHKLNKGECTPADICRSLIDDLADKILNLIDTAQWSTRRVLVAGGLALNAPLLESLQSLMPRTDFILLPESHVLEACGAALKAAEMPDQPRPKQWFTPRSDIAVRLSPLEEGLPLLDFRVQGAETRTIREGGSYILGVDAGSTTTKAVLLDAETGRVGASVYLRTHGNPLAATQQCIAHLVKEIGTPRIELIQAAVTGSGRELVALHLDNSPFFNEILAHGRATAEELPQVETVFEIGGQDSKYISFDNGIAVNYAMNDGCSAGTGSFLEESVLMDMSIPLEKIAERAFRGKHPVAFGERCSAFINTDLRNAMQQGATTDDVVAGLIYSIVQNYLVKVVGQAPIGEVVAFQGGVALNKAVGSAFALQTGKRVVVPRYPELMGCVGAALMARDRLEKGQLEKRHLNLEAFLTTDAKEEEPFNCPACDNFCTIRRTEIRGSVYPFGGLCAKYENARHQRNAREGLDLIAIRNQLMFKDFGPWEVSAPRGTVGIPLALSFYEWFPFFARFFNNLGFQVKTSDHISQRDLHTKAPICYPGEIAHAAVRDLLRREVDHVLVPHAMGDELPWEPTTAPPLTWEQKIGSEWIDGLFCHIARGLPALLKISVDEKEAKKLLTPMVSLADRLWPGTLSQLAGLAAQLAVSKTEILAAAEEARAHYRAYRQALAKTGREHLEILGDSPTVILAGRPYVVCSSRINLALPRKLSSRGYNVVPIDLLPMTGEPPRKRNMWMATQMIENAISFARQRPNWHLCFVSCFACSPDGMLEHVFRQQTSGQTYCHLEIDSHTAHAGFDTRIGAFLDILGQDNTPQASGGPKR
jgi:predicted CoA-substrate-specific enzyme activase